MNTKNQGFFMIVGSALFMIIGLILGPVVFNRAALPPAELNCFLGAVALNDVIPVLYYVGLVSIAATIAFTGFRSYSRGGNSGGGSGGAGAFGHAVLVLIVLGALGTTVVLANPQPKVAYAAAARCLLVDGDNAMTGDLHLDGNSLIFDTDRDTSMTGDSDNQIDISVAGVDDFQITADTLTVLAGSNEVFQDDSAAQFGTGSDSAISYDGTDTFWDLRASGTGDLMLALETAFPSPDPDAVHIWRGDSGTVDANSQSSLILEDDAATDLQFLTPNTATSSIRFGDEDSADQGIITYDHTSDQLDIATGGTTRWSITSTGELQANGAQAISTSSSELDINGAGGVVINEVSADANFRVESNNEQNMIMLDAGLNSIGFGTTGRTDEQFRFQSRSRTASVSTNVSILRFASSGVLTIPTGTTSLAGNMVVDEPNLAATGTITNAFTVRISNAPTEGTNNYALWVGGGLVQIDGSLVVGSATGGSQGTGTINAQGVYDDGVLLTDWVFQNYYGQEIPSESHFHEGDLKLYSLDETKTAVESEASLPWMPGSDQFTDGPPSLGQMATAIWQGQEQQQIYINELESRIAKLEQLLKGD